MGQQLRWEIVKQVIHRWEWFCREEGTGNAGERGNNFRIFAGAKSLSKWKKRGISAQGRVRLGQQQKPFLHVTGRWAEYVSLNSGRWSFWWWTNERGLMAPIWLRTKKYWEEGESQEGHTCHVTSCTWSNAYADVLKYFCWLPQRVLL